MDQGFPPANATGPVRRLRARHSSGRHRARDVFRSTGIPWGGNPTQLTRPRDGWISDLLVDSAVPRRYWATYSKPGSVFCSDDEGVSWTYVTPTSSTYL